MELFTCPNCDSPHFLVRWNEADHLWKIACEGCGEICSLIPTGRVELVMRGIDPS